MKTWDVCRMKMKADTNEKNLKKWHQQRKADGYRNTTLNETRAEVKAKGNGKADMEWVMEQEKKTSPYQDNSWNSSW